MTKKSKRSEQEVSPRVVAGLEEALGAMAAGRPAEEAATELARELSAAQAVELAAALAARESREAARLAAALAEAHPVKDARRAFKKTLYQLGRKGLSVAEKAEASVLKAPSPTRPPAYVSLPDPAGEQMVIAAVPGRRTYDACLCSVSAEGVEHFLVVNVPKKGLRELAAKVEEDSKLPIAETGDAHARLLLEEAQAASAARGRSVAPEFAPFLRALAAVAPRGERPAVYDLIEAAEVGRAEGLVARSAQLLENIGVLWHLPLDDVQPYVLQLEEAETSGLVLSQEQRQERFSDIIRKAVRELFDAPRRRAWRRRLEESAYVLARKGKTDEARLALAAALDFERGTDELRENPIALAVVSRSMAAVLKDVQSREEESLIIKP
jgi:hypothetical protein